MKEAGRRDDSRYERLVERELSRRRSGQALEPCPQTETLAAWLDRALPAEEAAALEKHLAACGRCEAIAATLIRTEPEVTYARPRAEPRPWTWHLRWLAPMATAAVVVAVGLTAMRLSPVAVQRQATTTDSVVSKAAAPPASASPAAAVPPAGVAASAAAQAERAEAAPKREAPSDEDRQAGAVPRRLRDEMRAARQAAPAAPSPTAPGVGPAPVPTLAEADKPAEVVTKPKGEAQQFQAAPPARADAAAVSPAPEGRRVEIGGAAGGVVGGVTGPVSVRQAPVAAKSRAASLELERGPVGQGFAPGGRVGWRWSRPGVILKTENGGAAWVEQSLPSDARLSSVSAVSPLVCWAVGRGVVVRTTDGANWQVVSAPSPGELVSVEARSGQVATIRSSDGALYETSDAGSTWRRRR